MASNTDLLTTQKNGVVATNNLNQTVSSLVDQMAYFKGENTSGALSSQTVAASGSGYLVSFAVVVAGAAGTINNASSTGGVSSSNVIAATPATVGIYPVGCRFSSGLVVSPGAGQSVVVTYSLD